MLKIRVRERRGRPKEAGCYMTWVEYQVVNVEHGFARIVFRAETQHEAERWIKKFGPPLPAQ